VWRRCNALEAKQQDHDDPTRPTFAPYAQAGASTARPSSRRRAASTSFTVALLPRPVQYRKSSN
jgi:hypothetical protein